MNQTWAPGDVRVATRGEFLAARETAVRELERGIGSPLGLLQNCALVFGAFFACIVAGSALSQPRVETFNVVFAVVMVVAALATIPFTVRRALRRRKLIAALLAWEAAERQARSLPPGHVRPELRTPFDARQDADFEDVALDARLAASRRAAQGRLVRRTTLPSFGLVLGLVLVSGVSGDEPVATRVSWGVAGAYLVVCCLVAIAADFRLWRRACKFRWAQTADIVAWRAERLLPGEPADVDPDWLREQALILAPFLVLSALAIVVRVRTSSPEVLNVTLAVLVLAGVATYVALTVRRNRAARRSAEHRAAVRAADQRAAMRAEHS
jgi:hypothetical protein